MHRPKTVMDADEQEVWLYLLNVLSEDKTTEITTIMALASTYQLLSSSLPSTITSLLLKTALQHHTRRFFNPTYADLISSLTAESPTHSGPIDAPNKLQAQPYTQGNGITNQSTSLTHTHNQNGSTSGLAGSNSFGSGSIDIDETLTLRSQYGRVLPPPPTTPPTRQAFLAEVEEVLGKFWHAENDAGRDGEWRRRRTGIDGSEREWVWLVTPFVCCLTRPVAVFLGFQGLMQRMRKSAWSVYSVRRYRSISGAGGWVRIGDHGWLRCAMAGNVGSQGSTKMVCRAGPSGCRKTGTERY